MCYDLARFRNSIEQEPLIPLSVIDKPPSAELRPDQLDQDSLPPYEELDPILKAYVEDDPQLRRDNRPGKRPRCR